MIWFLSKWFTHICTSFNETFPVCVCSRFVDSQCGVVLSLRTKGDMVNIWNHNGQDMDQIELITDQLRAFDIVTKNKLTVTYKLHKGSADFNQLLLERKKRRKGNLNKGDLQGRATGKQKNAAYQKLTSEKNRRKHTADIKQPAETVDFSVFHNKGGQTNNDDQHSHSHAHGHNTTDSHNATYGHVPGPSATTSSLPPASKPPAAHTIQPKPTEIPSSVTSNINGNATPVVATRAKPSPSVSTSTNTSPPMSPTRSRVRSGQSTPRWSDFDVDDPHAALAPLPDLLLPLSLSAVKEDEPLDKLQLVSTHHTQKQISATTANSKHQTKKVNVPSGTVDPGLPKQKGEGPPSTKVNERENAKTTAKEKEKDQVDDKVELAGHEDNKPNSVLAKLKESFGTSRAAERGVKHPGGVSRDKMPSVLYRSTATAHESDLVTDWRTAPRILVPEPEKKSSKKKATPSNTPTKIPVSVSTPETQPSHHVPEAPIPGSAASIRDAYVISSTSQTAHNSASWLEPTQQASKPKQSKKSRSQTQSQPSLPPTAVPATVSVEAAKIDRKEPDDDWILVSHPVGPDAFREDKITPQGPFSAAEGDSTSMLASAQSQAPKRRQKKKQASDTAGLELEEVLRLLEEEKQKRALRQRQMRREASRFSPVTTEDHHLVPDSHMSPLAVALVIFLVVCFLVGLVFLVLIL
eukprot:c12774_g1_i2.p1 GENE.c12774_g1_i2~~c12774_g1_i2.p1  ORF type:complete len:692 (-),score=174.29 c12774_g1_i2:115-2190(-)